MSDTIGSITVPTPVSSGLTFPLVSDFGYSTSRPWPIITHRFGELATLGTQRFQVGIGPRKFSFRRAVLSYSARTSLIDFFETTQGQFQTFLYNAPNDDHISTTSYTVVFEQQPLSVEELVNACRVGLNFIECPQPSSAPTYSIGSTCLRFPSSGLNTALLSQVQTIIPLIHIHVRDSSVPDIYLSDRRLTASGGSTVQSAMGWASSSQLYLPRLLGIGDPGSDTLLSQNINGTSDSVALSFGNADRVMTQLANSTDLMYASVDLCLLHVQSLIILQLWKGFVLDYQSDGSPMFGIQCSDGIYQLTQLYPNRTISRTCWKTYNDGVNCPFATKGTIIGGGNANFCDYTYGVDVNGNLISGANGCAQHSMTLYFGGMPVQPQGVNIKNNSTGVFGIGRTTVTATSIVTDTAWGQALPDIWCNQSNVGLLPPDALNAFIANGIVMDIRDEGDFTEVMAVLGSGPLGAFTIQGNASGAIITNSDGLPILIAPLADGFTAHGFKLNSSGTSPSTDTALGLRQSIGTDPILLANVGNDEFGLDQIGGTPGITPLAAGTAFAAVRYSKPSGINPSTTEGHSMTVPLSLGLTGYTWDASSVRSTVPGLTNPFWIAVNTLLRALGQNSATSTQQLSYFVLSSLFVGDGSGTAEIADTLITPIFGSTFSPQFQFQGTLAQQKPLRDWLTEILNVGQGYYTWEFGRLKLGCRINASAVQAFTYGNMLYQSLELHPIKAAFEHLIIDFADVFYQFQANTADYQDKDHAQYYGRAGSPLTSRMHSLGANTLDQALRLAVTRTREEIGGVNLNNQFNNGTNIDATEWAQARMAKFQTTILSLSTEVGQVISITHPDVPTGSANFRIRKWTLRKDWSILIEGQTVVASMYALNVGPRPTDVNPLPIPVLAYPEPQGQWGPYQVQANPLDALFPSEYTFDYSQTYMVNADGSASAFMTITGSLPINSYAANIGAPVWHNGSVTVSPTGGSLPGGVSLRVQICAVTGNGQYSPPSNVLYITIPTGTNTNSITISDILWPPTTSLAGFEIFLSIYDDLIENYHSGALTPGTPTTSYTPTSVTLSISLPRRYTWGTPNSDIQKLRVKIKEALHFGTLGAIVDSVSGMILTSSECVDSASTDNWSGRVLAVIGRDSASSPYTSFNITAFNPATGQFTLDRSPVGIVNADDVFVVCMLGYDNSATPTVFTDAGMSNATNPTPHTGMNPAQEVGAVLRVIKGMGRGLKGNVISATSTSWTLDTAIVIDSTSVWIIETRGWTFTQDSTPLSVMLPGSVTGIRLPTNNYLRQSVLIGVVTVSNEGVESEEGDMPLRMGYVFGSAGTIATAPGWAVLVITSNQVQPDLSVAKNFKLILNQAAQVTVLNPVWTGVASIPFGTSMTIYVYQDSTGYRPTPAWATGTGGFGGDVGAEVIEGDPGHYAVYKLTYQDDHNWHIDSFRA